MADVTFLDVRRLDVEHAAADVALAMDEDAFRAFYDRTAGALWGYLSRISGDRQVADDLLQEAYYRLLKSTTAFESESHRRNYLYRIATNLVNDSRRGARPLFESGIDVTDIPAPEAHATVERRADVRRAMGLLKPRERAMLWLAYAQGSSHSEIAEVLGLKTGSIKLLLFRARRKLAGLLQREVAR
ncbi:MAG TPA: RNA polymerase sigma factor [Vicinamibacterales bacterium]|nr:RNA polymerase sigma factor [Vicinamibacterales bacterium]